ncbi:MAG TPA: hypothetical protein VKP88_08925 [Candidatus Paceibacterota bacterium]|nr:hypothetical protein [Candidatus Paceibacterota bacterium]
MTKQQIIKAIRAGITKELQNQGHNINPEDVTIQEWGIADVTLKDGEVGLSLEFNGLESELVADSTCIPTCIAWAIEDFAEEYWTDRAEMATR